MNQIYALLASRMWAAEPTALHAWAAGKESIATLSSAGMSPRVVNGESAIRVDRNGGTATIHIKGVLMYAGPWWAKIDGDATDYLDIRAALDDAAQDSGVHEVLLAINSPGGDAVGLAETVAAVGRVRSAGKAVRSHISGMGTSAAYFIASSTDEITAEPDALVGSIGTMTLLRDTTALQDKIGVRLELVSSGPDKGSGADGKITPEYRAQSQRRIDAFATVFREQVATGRKMTTEQVAAVSTGDYWLASDAKSRGLVDATGSAPSPRAAQAAAPPESTPLAAASTEQESVMDVKILAALAVMSATHPTQAEALAAEAAKPGATVATMDAFIAPIAAKAKDDAHAAEVAGLRAKLAAAEKSRDEENARADKAEAKASHKTGASDPGPDDQGDSPKPKMTQAEYDKATPTAKAKHHAAGGVIVG